MARGQLRIYLGAAAGVGKTYAMLNEGRRRRDYGEDVVVGFVEPHRRPKTAAQIGDLEVVPRRKIEYRGTTLEEAFAGVAEGLATLLGAWFPEEGTEQRVQVEGEDLEALLATWVDELLYLHEVQDVVFGGFKVEHVSDRGLDGQVRVAPRGERELEGIGVKAATYHQLEVGRDGDGFWFARIYLDV